jgi:subtilisin family serine protease
MDAVQPRLTMKLFIAVTLSLFVTFAATAAQHVAGNYVVILNGNESPEVITRQHGLGRYKTWTSAVHGFASKLTGAQADRLEQDTRVMSIEPDITITLSDTNAVVTATGTQVLPSGVRRIGCTNNAAWNASAVTPIDVDIAIIDTGIELTHPDLNVYASTNFTATATANDGHGHGTHCAGIAAAKNNTIGVVGVAPGARLWGIKVLGDDGSGSLSSIISGVDYATKNSSSIEVASMSLGGQGDSAALRTAIQASVAKGIVYVVAAGNWTFEIYGGDQILGTSDDLFPAAYPEVLTVSALADSDGISGGTGASTSYGADDTLATFSNYSLAVDSSNPVVSPGRAIDLAAPGVNIYSTYKGGTYSTMSGTSMSCPHVAGVVALYIAQYGRPTTAAGVYAIRQALIDRAEPQAGWGRNPTNPNPVDSYPEGLVRADSFSAPVVQNYPVITISSPPPLKNGYYVYRTNTAITFTATATDAIDGNIASRLVWTSSIAGQIGTGGTFSRVITNIGLHYITAYATNTLGLVGASSFQLKIDLTPPAATLVVTVDAPANLSHVNNPVTFVGTAIDSVYGDLSSKLVWQSTVDGYIGTGSTITRYLTPGGAYVSASVTNTVGSADSTRIYITVSGTAPPATNYPPIVSITFPVEGASFAEGSSVTVSSSASDTEDGDLTSNIRVTDNINGPIGTGGSIQFFPSVGSHSLTASVSDTNGATASTSRSFSVYAVTTNTPPVITLIEPANNLTVVSNTAVVLGGIATDAQDGNITASLKWYNSMSGLIGTGGTGLSTFTTVGTNVVTASATDAGGLTTASSVNVIVTNAVVVTNAYPVVTVTAPTNGLTVTAGTLVAYAGTATDAEDGAIVPDWYDSIAGTLGSGTSGSYTPVVGTHRLTASATDADGQVGSQTVLIQVNNTNALPTQLVVTVTANKSMYANKEKALLTATVRTTGGVAVSGATCLFSIRGANGKTQTKTYTTASSGVASFYLTINKQQLGLGVTTVTVNASKTGSLSGTESTTFTVYK